MAIYRPPRSPWRGRLVMAGAGLLIGALIVWAFLPQGEPSPAERAATVRTELIAAEGALEIAAIEYAESVEGGEIVSDAEFQGAKAALARSRARYDAVRPTLRGEGGHRVLDEMYGRLERLMGRHEDPVTIERLVRRVTLLLGALRSG